MPRPVLLGIGGHLVSALVKQLGAVPGLAGKVDFHLSPDMPGGRPRASPEVLARAILVLDEDGAMDTAERAALPASCPVLRLPRLEFASLWPLMAEHPARGAAVPAVPAPFGDRIALGVLRSGTAPAQRQAAYDAVAPGRLFNLDAAHDDEAREMFRREAGCDIRIAGFVLSRFRNERLFHSAVHPAAPLLLQVMAQLLGHPALSALAEDTVDAQLRAIAPGLEAVFADAQAPVHPAVAAHFALNWWSPTLRYRQGPTERDFAGWIARHLREAEIEAPPLGAGLAELRTAARLADVTVLHPPAEIARVTPFFATAIDPAVARHGAALLSAESGRYAVPESLMATLTDATVLGHSGAVLHGGAALADTMPPGVASLPPPPAPTRRLDAPCFLGFGHGWHEDPHGMTGILPRLVAYARLRRHQPGLCLLLPDILVQAPWLREMQALLGIADAALVPLTDTPVHCTRLTLTSRFDAAEVAPFARVAAQALAAMVKLSAAGPRLLYLRSSTTTSRLANAAAVAAALEARGFTTVDADHRTLADRIALLRGADAVVAAQGPTLAELAFCPAGAAVLELLGPANPTPLFWSLATCAKLRYGYIVGAPTEDGDYTIPLEMLDYATTIMIQSK